MKLYSFPLSPFAARVRGAIYAKDLEVEITLPPDGWQQSDSYRALNPMQRVPVLVLDDGTAIAESGVIVEYLEDAFPERPLRPRKAEAAARVRFVTQVAETYVMGPMGPLFTIYDAKEKDTKTIDAQLVKLRDGLGRLDGLLAEDDFACGEGLSSADVWLTPLRFVLDGLIAFAQLDGLYDDCPRLAAYAGVVQRDPVLARVWAEMSDGLTAFIARRTAEAAAGATS
jgi:glutathione S-transferase